MSDVSVSIEGRGQDFILPGLNDEMHTLQMRTVDVAEKVAKFEITILPDGDSEAVNYRFDEKLSSAPGNNDSEILTLNESFSDLIDTGLAEGQAHFEAEAREHAVHAGDNRFGVRMWVAALALSVATVTTGVTMEFSSDNDTSEIVTDDLIIIFGGALAATAGAASYSSYTWLRHHNKRLKESTENATLFMEARESTLGAPVIIQSIEEGQSL